METPIKVLFVASGNSKIFEISPFIKVQGDSLVQKGVDISYFYISGKGIKGYLNSALELRKHLNKTKINIIHAHYSLSGWVSVLAFSHIPIVLSLMGSDVFGDHYEVEKTKFKSKPLALFTKLIQPFVNTIISKSSGINNKVFKRKNNYIIPNGVCLDTFKLFNTGIREELGFENNFKYVLFLGDKQNENKNFVLLQKAFQLIDYNKKRLITPYPVSQSLVAKYLNAADVLVLTSFMEGSPNVIKEAMACNCPIVTTDVGDVKLVFGETKGCYITTFEPEDVAEKINLALVYGKRTNGRNRILELGYDSEQIANRILKVYSNILN